MSCFISGEKYYRYMYKYKYVVQALLSKKIAPVGDDVRNNIHHRSTPHDFRFLPITSTCTSTSICWRVSRVRSTRLFGIFSRRRLVAETELNLDRETQMYDTI